MTLEHGYREELVGEGAIFSHLPSERVSQLIEGARILQCEPGDTLLRYGDPGENVLLVLSGHAAVELPVPEGSARLVNLVGPGELLGEMAVLQGTTRSASVKALEPCVLLEIGADLFLSLLLEHPGLAIRVLGVAQSRLRRITEAIGTLPA